MQAFEGIFSGLKSKCEALELENTQLKEDICLPDLQVLFDLCVCVRACMRVCVNIRMCVFVCA